MPCTELRPAPVRRALARARACSALAPGVRRLRPPRRAAPPARRRRPAGRAASAAVRRQRAGRRRAACAASRRRAAAAEPARSWDELRCRPRSAWSRPTRTAPTSACRRELLLAIPVLEIELNGDGSVRSIEVLRHPRQAQDTSQLADRRGAPRRALRRRVAPAQALAVHRDLPVRRRPHASSRARSTLTSAGVATARRRRMRLRHNRRHVLQPADPADLGAHRRDPADRRRVLAGAGRRARRTWSRRCCSSSSR